MAAWGARMAGMVAAYTASLEVRGVAWLACVLVILVLAGWTLLSVLHQGRP